ncbi:polysaccharide biosynthesis/export family protein [Thalassococcus lentus]|uniref:Polysaccharide biosynthesis/export family protein n=1 Tax=Thalassococcus lentus TaxID=1210524 RepID=A0ABT4XQ05_9RHOB|nr:polysaccharide biosynthesis/export family protein [Thalassococcus lentus]MDA7423943.1 polysaccharide biosynthesis/export family protein [Thalassococcus lentus]
MFLVNNRLLGSVLGFAFVVGCTPAPTPENIAPVESGGAYQAQYRDLAPIDGSGEFLFSAQMNAEKCRPFAGGKGFGKAGPRVPSILLGERLSRDDLVDVRVADDETFNGQYVISRDGKLKLPFLPAITAQGRQPEDVQAEVARLLVREGFYDERPRISLRLADFARVNVAVSGAVFEPHSIVIGGRSATDIDIMRQQALGASTEARNLSVALRSVGGVRPDADLSAVELHRGGKKYVLDMRGVFEGRHATDIILLTGDEIVVPSRLCFQDDLMRPGPVSPPGISLYLSNLTQTALANAPSAIGRDVREVPYGARFMQAVVDTNCVGGAKASSAHRWAILFTRDPMTGVSIVIERNIEEMLRRADRDDYDPYLLPGDAIACYDSRITNLAEAARVIGAVAGAAAVLP